MANSEKCAILIPARYGSTRLNAKALIKVGGKSIIQWVWEKAKGAKLADAVIIATDHELIYKEAKSFGADVEMTSKNHQSGSDRIAEVAQRHPEFEYIINLQGDEPMITPESIDEAIKAIKNPEAQISTLIREIKDREELDNPNVVKCVTDNNGFALYFSRSKIPYERNETGCVFYGHMGIYGYKRDSLFKMTKLPQSILEKTESLEQLRALQAGMKIITAVVNCAPVGIDTKEDLDKFASTLK